MFQLAKWYLDVISDEGVALIAYAARLKVSGLSVSYASMLRAAPTLPSVEHATIRGVASPSLDSEECAWTNRALGLEGRWHREEPPIEQLLLDGPDGCVRWTCHMPRARAEVRDDLGTVSGSGYVEHLEMTIAPWKLPFNRLRWGHHNSATHSVVWIDWDDGDAGRWIWLNGESQPDARLTESGISGLSGGCELRLCDRRDVRRGGVLASLDAVIPALRGHLGGPLGRMHEYKQMSRSMIVSHAGAVEYGQCLHEVVQW